MTKSERRLGGFSVALVGPDGAGKTTLARSLTRDAPMPARYIYMGVNLETSSLVLPTTRLLLEIKKRAGGRPDFSGGTGASSSTWRSTIRLANLILEEWFRAAIVATWRRSRLVVMDRHFLADYRAHDMDVNADFRPLMVRLHGWLLRSFYPRPDLVIVLTAPPEVLYERKPEGSLEARIARHAEYQDLQSSFPDVVEVDASGTRDEIERQCRSIIEARLTSRESSR